MLRVKPAIILLAAAVAACSGFVPRGPGGAGDAGAPAQAPGTAYVIGPADVLSIGVLNHEDLNRTVTVRPDGRFSFALVGEIEAAGQTPPQLQETMVAALAEYIDVLPGEVSVIVDSVHSYTVSVLGEVRLPGRFEFRNQVTVLDALAQAGGLTEFADTSDILILRTYQGQEERIRFNYKKSVRIDDNDPRVLLMPGDVVVVP